MPQLRYGKHTTVFGGGLGSLIYAYDALESELLSRVFYALLLGISLGVQDTQHVCWGIGLSDGLRSGKRAWVRIFYTYQSYFCSLFVRCVSAPIRKTRESVSGNWTLQWLRVLGKASSCLVRSIPVC